jgi:hypothetical protein
MGVGRNFPKKADVRTSFAQCHAPTVDRCDVARVTIDMLPDVALLEIFDFYVDVAWIEAWYTLVHVCRKWRDVVFGSPRRLDLRLHCNAKTPVRATLDVWPLLPIVIWGNGKEMGDVDNIIAALEHKDRICRIDLFYIPSSQFENVLATMQQQFPALTRLQLMFQDETAPVIPASFLGGSAPRLQTLILDHTPFPGLPKLLLSATHLVHLELWRIPRFGYVAPEAMVTCLSVLTSLETFVIQFESPTSLSDRRSRHPPPQTRTLLPILTVLRFKGVAEYLEDLVARIDAPLLDKLDIICFHQLIIDSPQLTQFISRSPKFKAQDEARVVFFDWDVLVTLPQTSNEALKLRVSCRQPDWQLSSLAQVCGSSIPQTHIRAVEHLYILEDRLSDWQDDIENSQWLEVLQPFTAVKDLYVSLKLTQRIAPALQELVEERATGVLPALQTLFFEEALPSGPVQEAIGQFVSARELASHPVTISRWERKDFQ